LSVSGHGRGDLGAHAESVRAALGGLPIAVVSNPDWEHGMATLNSRRSSLGRTARTEALLLTLCDPPRLSTAHLDQRIGDFERTRLPVASYYAHKCAVPALFPRSLFSSLATLSGDSAASRLLNDGRSVRLVSWADGEIDADTLETEQRLSP